MTMDNRHDDRRTLEPVATQPDAAVALFEAAEERQVQALLRRAKETAKSRRPAPRADGRGEAPFDYDHIVEQSFPASDPPPLP